MPLGAPLGAPPRRMLGREEEGRRPAELLASDSAVTHTHTHTHTHTSLTNDHWLRRVVAAVRWRRRGRRRSVRCRGAQPVPSAGTGEGERV